MSLDAALKRPRCCRARFKEIKPQVWPQWLTSYSCSAAAVLKPFFSSLFWSCLDYPSSFTWALSSTQTCSSPVSLTDVSLRDHPSFLQGRRRKEGLRKNVTSLAFLWTFSSRPLLFLSQEPQTVYSSSYFLIK